MERHDAYYRQYVQILREELRPATGCTEPIAIAYAAAKARSDFSVSGGARHAMPQSAVSSRGVGIRRPGRLCSLHRASMAMAAAVVWNVTTSQNIRSLISLSP